MIKVFERFDSKIGNTQCFSIFNRHHTELNDMYWSFIPAESYAKYTTKGNADDVLTVDALVLSGPDARRPPRTMGQWRVGLAEFANWSRLGMLLSAASYLELYMRRMFRLALQSDPLVLYGLSQNLDGVILLKRGKILAVASNVDACCRGTWADRARNIQATFGACPSIITSSLSDLEKIRVMRNKVGHAFGRTYDPIHDEGTSGGPPERLSEERLKKWLALIESVASALDVEIALRHIGFFEYINLYHLRKEELAYGKYGKKSRPSALSSLIVDTIGTRVERGACEDLIEYYKRC